VPFLFLGWFCKPAIGYCMLTVLGVHELFVRRGALPARLLRCVLYGLVVAIPFLYSTARGSWQDPSTVSFEWFYLVKEYADPPLQGLLGIPFLAVHYFFPLLAVGIVLAYRRLAPERCRHVRTLFLYLVVATAAAHPAMHFQLVAAAGAAFTPVSMFLAVPIVLSLKRHLPGRLPDAFRGALAATASAILIAGCLGAATFGLWRGARTARWLIVAGNWLRPSPMTPYAATLRAIGRVAEDRNFGVYVPKAETGFWTYVPDAYLSAGFHIPVLSNRPALFGLPGRRTRDFGIGRHPEHAIRGSFRARIGAAELVRECRRLGLDGCFVVTAGGCRRLPAGRDATPASGRP
jgi:hypothetical protein